MHRTIQIFKPLLLLSLGCLYTGYARGEILPWLNDDPFGAQKKITAYGIGLHPDHCPALPDINKKLKLNTVVIAVLCHNPDTKTAYLSLVAQADSYATSYSAYLPTVTGTASAQRSNSFAKDVNTSNVSKSSGLSAAMTLYDFGQREINIDVAEQALIAAGHSYSSSLQGFIATTLQSYYNLLTAQNAVDIAKESERYSKESYEAAGLRHKLGLVPLADELQAKSAYSSAQLATQQADNALSQAQAALASLMGLSPDTPIIVEELDDSTLIKDPFAGKAKELMEEAKQNRSDLQASRAGVLGAEAGLRALERRQLATISAGINTNLADNGYFTGSPTRSQSIGISVSIPIFNGFTDTYNKHSAKINLEAQKERLTRSELNVEQDVWKSWQNYQTAKQSWEVTWDQLKTAVQLRDVALGRYKEGLGTILDVLNAQLQYSTALQNQLRTRYNLLTTRVDLVRAVGVLNIDTMTPPRPSESSAPKTPTEEP